jgi:hypothetical protein
MKALKLQTCEKITSLFNVCLENKRVPETWKGAMIHRIPKKDNIADDPSTWRDISLLPTIYKVFMKCILSRVLPWLVDNNILSPNQKAYINRQGMNEHVFCLKTGIDDFKHESCKFYSVFLDFRDAFGTLTHNVMIHALEEIQLPRVFIDIIKDVYSSSFIQVICGKQLTDPVPLQVGIKTGCPWSAINFVLAINQWIRWLCDCAPPNVISPNPIQGYADDVQLASREESVIKDMLSRTDTFLDWSGLEIKQSKCAVLYQRRSGGNRWYKSKTDRDPEFSINSEPIRVYDLHETYTYLGHKFNVAGEWKKQVEYMVTEFTTRLDLIDVSPLPLLMKLEAIRQVALSRIQHLFSNVHLACKTLRELNNQVVSVVRKWFGLNTHTTRDIIFQPKQEGGLGVPNVEWIYNATRLSHLTNMLNSDDRTVRELARSSLFLDMKRRKVPLAGEGEPSFLGFRRKPNNKMDSHSAGFGVSSDWPDLNDLCVRAGVSLDWVKSDSDTVMVSEDVITDCTISVRVTVNDTEHHVSPAHTRRYLLGLEQQRQQQHWTGLKLQGKLACIPTADHTVSHTIFKNYAVDEDILTFAVKARLQVLPTRLNLSLWYPNRFPPHCLHHDNSTIESLSHILNGCHVYKGMYISRHDRIVDLLVKNMLLYTPPSSVKVYTHSRVSSDMFTLCNNEVDYFSNVTANTPDVIVVDEVSREVTILEVSCTFDYSLEEAFLAKVTKYQLLRNEIAQLGYTCKLLVFIFGSLGHVHRLVIRGLQMAGIPKPKAKALAKFCSISVLIGSRHIWRRRCFLYP